MSVATKLTLQVLHYCVLWLRRKERSIESSLLKGCRLFVDHVSGTLRFGTQKSERTSVLLKRFAVLLTYNVEGMDLLNHLVVESNDIVRLDICRFVLLK